MKLTLSGNEDIFVKGVGGGYVRVVMYEGYVEGSEPAVRRYVQANLKPEEAAALGAALTTLAKQ